jgi:hypothetical protein
MRSEFSGKLTLGGRGACGALNGSANSASPTQRITNRLPIVRLLLDMIFAIVLTTRDWQVSTAMPNYD